MSAMGWRTTIRLSDIFHEDIAFEDKRDVIVSRLRTSRWLDNSESPEEVREAIDNLSDSTDVYQFDCWWEQLYDLADQDRVWLGTF